MTDEEICKIMDWEYHEVECDNILTRIKQVVKEAQKQERERCAKVCDSLNEAWGAGPNRCAAAIRELK